MDWKWIIILSLFGALVGLVSVFGWSAGADLYLGLGVQLITAALIGYNIKRKHFLHGLITGALGGALSGLLHIVFFDAYVANNPRALEQMKNVPEDFDFKTLFLIGLPVGIVVGALITGLLSLLAGKILGEKAPKPVEPPPPDQPAQQM